MARLLSLLVALYTAAAVAQPRGVPLKLRVGTSVSVRILSVMNRCDDPSLVEISASADGKALELKGLKPGRTQCSLGAMPGKGQRVLYDVEVVAAP